MIDFQEIFPRRTQGAIAELSHGLLAESQLNVNFLALTVSSCLIATLGLIMNSAAAIVGAMVIAPLILPLRGLALGAIAADRELLSTSIWTLGVATGISLLISGLVGGLFGVPASAFDSEILSRTQPNLADFMVAIAAGFISGFARIRPQIADALAGTAIAVALMPPLCVVGLSISQQAWEMGSGSFLLYLTNLLGITLACIVVFIFGGYYFDTHNVRKSLFWFLGMTGLLVVPLSFSFLQFVRRGQLADAIRTSLQTETITFGQTAELIALEIRGNSYPWSSQPVNVILRIRSTEMLTSNQVRLVQDFLKRRFGQAFRLHVRISEYREITADSPPPKPEPTKFRRIVPEASTNLTVPSFSPIQPTPEQTP
jgi:uncharacterized hydrophobic protein (TIGR00271 family)